jgi:molybdopterin adenylyltransferase
MSKVISVNISEEKGTVKKPVASITLDETGIVQDAHAGAWHRQVSLLAKESVEKFSKQESKRFCYGDFAENITTEGLCLVDCKIRDILKIGSVVLEVTQIGKKCHGGNCAVFQEVGKCVMPKEGIFSRVLQGGEIKPGDTIEHRPRPLKIKILTLSDRASRGEYEDKSGPAIKTCLDLHFAHGHWHPEIDAIVLPDDAEQLRTVLQATCCNDTDIIFTTGGTGIGPRDITPDVVKPMLDKEIPGIMEYVRLKHADRIPSALISRSVAGLIGSTLIYTLPGSVKAVEEYMEAILKTLDHSLLMLMGIDSH